MEGVFSQALPVMEDVMAKRVAMYLRVSTDEQTVANQRRELETVAERNGWEIVATFQDHGISGAKGRDSVLASIGYAGV